MPNPTTAKPTAVCNEWLSTASTVGELMLCNAVLSANEPARDVVGAVLGEPFTGLFSTNGNAHGYGHPPQVVPGAFTFNSLSDPVYRFGAGTAAVRFPNRGFASSANNQSIWCVFKPLATASPRANTVCVWGHGADVFHRGIAYNVSTAGVITVGRYYSGSYTSSTVNLTSGKTYLVSLTQVSTTSWLINVYCYDDQAYVTPSGTGTTFTVTAVSSNGNATDAVLGFNPSFNGYDFNSFVGDVYACGLSTATFDPATNGYFAALVADPCAAARGTYAGGGALTAQGCTTWDTTTSAVAINTNRPTGGTPASYQYRLHRSLTASFTPDSTTRISSLQSSLMFTDTTPAAGIDYFYKVEQYDGTSTVYTTTATTNSSQAAGRLSKGDFFFGVISDSRWSSLGQTAPIALCRILRANGWRCGFVGMGAGSTLVYSVTASLSWQPNTTQDPINGQASTVLLANAMAAFANAANITNVFCQLGVNDANANTPSVFNTKYGYIKAIVLAAGYKLYMSPPYLPSSTVGATEVQVGRVQSYQPQFIALDNGTTCIALGTQSYDLSASGVDCLARDHLHYSEPSHDGAAVSRALLAVIDPSPRIIGG